MSESSQPEDRKETDANSKVASELNNLIQIISGTSSLIENIWEGRAGSEKYFVMLRASIERAEQVTAQIAAQAGGTNRKVLLRPDVERTPDSTITTASPRGHKHSILVVDDEPMALTLLQRILTEAGYEVGVAQSGFECLDLFRREQHRHDLVLLDLAMPLMDGEETFHRLRSMCATANVMMMAGFIDNARLERMMSRGLSGFLGKPFAPEDILSVIASVIAGAEQSRANTTPDGIAAAV